MLTELHVRDLGVIEEARLLLSPGMTALSHAQQIVIAKAAASSRWPG